MGNKIIRSICLFTDSPSEDSMKKALDIERMLTEQGFEVQTHRLCASNTDPRTLINTISDPSFRLSVGTNSYDKMKSVLPDLCGTDRVIGTNIDLTNEEIQDKHIDLLFDIIQNNAAKTFDFTYGFNLPASSPYFPSAKYERNGFSIGLQSPDLSEGCNSLEDWFSKMKNVWDEVCGIFQDDNDFLGIDSSIAPLYEGKGSLLNFVRRLGYSFSESVTTDIYIQMTRFIKQNNPKPIGLCGLMIPCLEDFELANEYEQGNFTVERNIYLSLHSGLGIDVYPLGVDESRERVCQIAKLVQSFSNKYQKPLAIRFVSDGTTKIGERANFKNEFLKDVVIRKL